MRISYGRTAYVNECGPEMIDALQKSNLPCTMQDKDYLQIDREDLISALDELNERKDRNRLEETVLPFLNEAYANIKGEFDSVMFIS